MGLLLLLKGAAGRGHRHGGSGRGYHFHGLGQRLTSDGHRTALTAHNHRVDDHALNWSGAHDGMRWLLLRLLRLDQSLRLWLLLIDRRLLLLLLLLLLPGDLLWLLLHKMGGVNLLRLRAVCVGIDLELPIQELGLMDLNLLMLRLSRGVVRPDGHHVVRIHGHKIGLVLVESGGPGAVEVGLLVIECGEIEVVMVHVQAEVDLAQSQDLHGVEGVCRVHGAHHVVELCFHVGVDHLLDRQVRHVARIHVGAEKTNCVSQVEVFSDDSDNFRDCVSLRLSVSLKPVKTKKEEGDSKKKQDEENVRPPKSRQGSQERSHSYLQRIREAAQTRLRLSTRGTTEEI